MRRYFEPPVPAPGLAMIASAVLAIALVSPATAPIVPAPDVRENVGKGLKWLADQQRADGTWTGNGNFFTVNTTAYAGLALLMEGSTLREGLYAANLRKAVAWFEKIAQPNGLLVPADDPNERGRSMQGHAAGLLFLASAYDTDDDDTRRARLAKVLRAAVKYAVEGQSPRGGWGAVATPMGTEFTETSSTAFMLHALCTAEKAAIPVPRGCFDKAARYIAEGTNAGGGVVYTVGAGLDLLVARGELLTTAASAAVFMGVERKPGLLPNWVGFTQKNPPYLPRAGEAPQAVQSNSFTLQQHLAVARVAHGLGETGHRLLDPGRPEPELLVWSAYRERLFPYLQSIQSVAGNWPDQNIGPAYGTALALVILQLDNDYLPAFSR